MSVNRRSTFGASGLDKVRFSWNITKGCSSLSLRVEGQVVPAVGSMEVSVPTSRRLTVRGQILGCCSAVWSGPFVLAGRFVHYPVRSDGTLGAGQRRAGSGKASIDAAAREVVESMRPTYRNHFADRRIEIHILPEGHGYEELPPWAGREFEGTPPYGISGGTNDPYTDEHGKWGPGPDVHTIGIPATGGTHVVTHELGHAVLSHAGLDVYDEVEIAWIAHGWCPGGEGCDPSDPEPEWVGCLAGDDYGARNPHEYWAEGTAALFIDTPGPCPVDPVTRPDPNQYTREYLAETDPYLDQALRRVFEV